MARGARVRLKSAGARAVLTSPGVAGRLEDMASAIAGRANSMMSPDSNHDERYRTGYLNETTVDAKRARARVFTASQHAKRNNNKHNTLLRSLDAGRG